MTYRIESNFDGGVTFADYLYDKDEHWLVTGGNGAHRPRKGNVTITEIDEADVVRDFAVGDHVVIRKYGSDYNGHVTRVGTKRLDVEFRTVAGNDKVARGIPAKEVRKIGPHRFSPRRFAGSVR